LSTYTSPLTGFGIPDLEDPQCLRTRSTHSTPTVGPPPFFVPGRNNPRTLEISPSFPTINIISRPGATSYMRNTIDSLANKLLAIPDVDSFDDNVFPEQNNEVFDPSLRPPGSTPLKPRTTTRILQSKGQTRGCF
jgi:hypothetical protein